MLGTVANSGLTFVFGNSLAVGLNGEHRGAFML